MSLLLMGCENIVCSKLQGVSMEPTIHNGSTFKLNESFPYSKLKTGDIVCYYSPRCVFTGTDFICHRIKAIGEPGQFIMMGDNNKFFDQQELKENNYMGKVISIEGKKI